MIDKSRSTVEFRSNLQHVNSGKWNSVRAAVRNPFALEKMKNKGFELTPSQEQQYKFASIHCHYAFADDYPWGTIWAEDGKEKAICKCLNTECYCFQKCRPDFENSELLIFEENKAFSGRVLEFSHRRNDTEVIPLETLLQNKLNNSAELLGCDNKNINTTGEIETKPENDSIWDEKPVELTQVAFLGTVHSESGSALIEVPTSQESANETEKIQSERYQLETTVVKPVPAIGMQVKKAIDFSSFVPVDQDSLIYSSVDQRTLVNAGPGTGKTWTLIEKLINLINDEKTDPEGIMILCFSRAAVDVIEQRLRRAAEVGRIGYEYQSVDIRTFDSFATFVLSWTMEQHSDLLPANYSLEGQDYNSRIVQATSVIRKKGDLLDQCDHLIVDEVQDLVGCRAELVLELLQILPESSGFTLLGDACQALYDWQSNDTSGIMSSDEFYRVIFKRWPGIEYISFENNHRQTEALSRIAYNYRTAILTGNPESRNAIVAEILSQIQESGIDIQSISAENISNYRQEGTLGILTRTNGQALKISEHLRNADIPHILQRNASSANLKPWIAEVFLEYQYDTVNESMFTPVYQSVSHTSNQEQTHNAWTALVSAQYSDGKTRYTVEDLLKGLLRNGKNEALFISSDIAAQITVSNIHRAKGREFDSILVLADVLGIQKNSEDDLQEHKVKYVAITRPRKKLSEIAMKQQYIYIDKQTRRCYQASFSKQHNKYLTHIEVGLSGDIDNRSFAENIPRQDFIRNNLQPGTRLKLLKLPECEGLWIKYKIVLEENENIVLGVTGREFAEGLKRAMQRIWERCGDIDYKYYGNTFGDIYVEDMISCISVSGVGLKGAKTFGKIAVWKGFTISGFAGYERDLY